MVGDATSSSSCKSLGEIVPVVDLAGGHGAAVAAVDAALKKFGFFYVKNHGMDAALLQEQFQVAADLFALPRPVKESMPFNPQLDIGYVGSGVQSLDVKNHDDSYSAAGGGDTKEQFMMTNNRLITDLTRPHEATTSTCSTILPNDDDVFAGSVNFRPNVPNHARVARQYASAALRLNNKLNHLLFDALDLEENNRHLLGDQPFLVLKQMRYAGGPSDPARGKFGAGAHTDWGSFTILATDDTPGLQINMGKKEQEEQWLPVPPKRDCLIINSGDQIAQLTNGAYRSAVHRVVTTSDRPRYSTAIFTYFSLSAEVAPLPQFVEHHRPARYPYGRTSMEYFHFKLSQSMEKGGMK